MLSPITLGGPDPAQSTYSACAQVVSRLPVTLAGRRPRVVHGPQFAVAWGSPAIVFRCGITRPSILSPDNPTQGQNIGAVATARAWWLPSDEKHQTTWYLVDRSVYVSVVVPGSVSGDSVMPQLSSLIVAALPTQVCAFGTVGPDLPKSKSCVYRP